MADSQQRLPSALHLSRDLLASMAAEGAAQEQEHEQERREASGAGGAGGATSPGRRFQKPHETRVHLRRTGSVDIYTSGSAAADIDDLLADPSSFEASFPSAAAADIGAAAVDLGVSPRLPGIHLTSELPPETRTPRGGASTTQAPPPAGSSLVTTASSKAVLGALRALQEKIRRLEGERAHAVAEAEGLRAQLAEAGLASEMRWREEAMDHKEEMQELRLAYGRLLQERGTAEEKLAASEERRGKLAVEAQRLRARLEAEAGARREAEARVAEVAARIGKLEEALRGRGAQEGAALRGLEEALAQERAARAEVEGRNEKFGDVLLSVMDMHQHLLQHYHPPATSPAALGALRSAALRRGQHKPGGGATVAPFLPAPHRRTYNLLATLSQAVRECRRQQRVGPRQVLDALYDLALQDSSLSVPRPERSPFAVKAGAMGAGGLEAASKGRASAMATGQLQEAIQQQEEELGELQGRYEALLEEARRGLTPAAAAARFREEDLRALVDAIHRREVQLEKLKRQLQKRLCERGHQQHQQHQQQLQPPLASPEERSTGRLSLLSEIRGVSGLSLFEEGLRR